MENFAILRAIPENAIRHYYEPDHKLKSKFDVDRDRIIYSKEFRRLSGKTQLFVAGFDDHVRTRLTHTLEVTQIAQTISKILGFSQTLTEVIALAHDVGHTPFGHVGERTLNFVANGCDRLKPNYEIHKERKGFKHNWQSIRVVTELEKYPTVINGINLTDYALWGILHHSNLSYPYCKHSVEELVDRTIGNESFSVISERKTKCNLRQKYIDCPHNDTELKLTLYNKYNNYFRDKSWSFEALVVRIADEIAQRHHDLEDGLQANLFTKQEIIDKIEECFMPFFDKEDEKKYKEIRRPIKPLFLMDPINISDFVSNLLIVNIINESKKNLEKLIIDYKIKRKSDFERKKRLILKDLKFEGLYKLVNYSPDFAEAESNLHNFLEERVLNSHLAQSMDGKSNLIIRNLIKAYLTNPQQLPDQTIIHLFSQIYSDAEWENYKEYSVPRLSGILRNDLNYYHYQSSSGIYKNTLIRTICDFIAGMTDSFAIKQYEILYGTSQVFEKRF